MNRPFVTKCVENIAIVIQYCVVLFSVKERKIENLGILEWSTNYTYLGNQRQDFARISFFLAIDSGLLALDLSSFLGLYHSNISLLVE